MRKKTVFVVAAVLVNDQNQILLAERPEGRSLAGLWEFPGGKVDEGEIPAYALARELMEEIAITVAPRDLHPITFVEYDYPEFTLFMPVYLCRKWQGEINPQENQRVAWVDMNKLKDYPVPPADEELILKLPKLLSI
jgi:8-oxo-dGTP diphosphatase